MTKRKQIHGQLSRDSISLVFPYPCNTSTTSLDTSALSLPPDHSPRLSQPKLWTAIAVITYIISHIFYAVLRAQFGKVPGDKLDEELELVHRNNAPQSFLFLLLKLSCLERKDRFTQLTMIRFCQAAVYATVMTEVWALMWL